jgi:hypothetical protein
MGCKDTLGVGQKAFDARVSSPQVVVGMLSNDSSLSQKVSKETYAFALGGHGMLMASRATEGVRILRLREAVHVIIAVQF